MLVDAVDERNAERMIEATGKRVETVKGGILTSTLGDCVGSLTALIKARPSRCSGMSMLRPSVSERGARTIRTWTQDSPLQTVERRSSTALEYEW